MGVVLRGSVWYYDFRSGGKRYQGRCDGCATKTEAERFVSDRKRLVGRLSQQRSAKALVENFRQELTGGRKVSLEEAWGLAEGKPRKKRRSEEWVRYTRGMWGHFLAFLKERHPEAKLLGDVSRSMAEEWVGSLSSAGDAGGTIRAKIFAVSGVFRALSEDAGLLRDPFAGIPRPSARGVSREVFTPEEVEKILASADPVSRLFAVALFTGLREGDVCRLRWSEVDLPGGMVRLVAHKTGTPVAIPIIGRLRTFLDSLPRSGEYVLPEIEEAYRRGRLPKMVRRFLDGLRITRRVTKEGRVRSSSVKDVHSCRHTFCWLAGQAGIPLPTVQSIVGHMTPEMTAHYSAHVTEAQKREQIRRMETGVLAPKGSARQTLHDLVERLPSEKIEEVTHLIEKLL